MTLRVPDTLPFESDTEEDMPTLMTQENLLKINPAEEKQSSGASRRVTPSDPDGGERPGKEPSASTDQYSFSDCAGELRAEYL